MSEVAILPFQDNEKSSFVVADDKNPLALVADDKTILADGEITASFTMYNITDEQYYSDLKSQGWQIYASNMPLNNGLYWIFFIQTDETLKDRYNQNDIILDNASTATIFYRTCKKPLNLQNVTKTNVLPAITTIQRLRFGNKYNLDEVNSLSFEQFNIDAMDRDLTQEEVTKVIEYQLSKTNYNPVYFLKSVTGVQAIGYTFASLLNELVKKYEDVTYIKVTNEAASNTTNVAVFQGYLAVDFVEGRVTKEIKINDDTFIFGQIDLYSESVSDDENNM